MESMLLTFSVLGLLFLLKFQESPSIINRLKYSVLSASFFTFAFSVKFAGFYSSLLGFLIGCRHLWQQLSDKTISDIRMALHILFRIIVFTTIPISIYVGLFYVHFGVLNKAGPHDSIMTSAFQVQKKFNFVRNLTLYCLQASLEGGLASITKGQPLNVVHGSQITLRHTLGRTCWLHSHPHVYPVRYPDKRGSSHQQQVTCYRYVIHSKNSFSSEFLYLIYLMQHIKSLGVEIMMIDLWVLKINLLVLHSKFVFLQQSYRLAEKICSKIIIWNFIFFSPIWCSPIRSVHLRSDFFRLDLKEAGG